MVRQDEKLPDLDLVLKDSSFEEALECIKGVFERLKILTVYDLENAPRSLTCSFCGISTHKLIQHILNWMEQDKMPAPKVEEEPEPEPDPVPETKEEIPEPEKVAPAKRTPRRSKKTSSPRKKE